MSDISETYASGINQENFNPTLRKAFEKCSLITFRLCSPIAACAILMEIHNVIFLFSS